MRLRTPFDSTFVTAVTTSLLCSKSVLNASPYRSMSARASFLM
jgi:hypothetical protein